MPPRKRREHVVDAALRVIVEQGYDGVSIEAVARAAGVTRPVIYDHFQNLGQLLQALIKREENYALAQLAEVVPDVMVAWTLCGIDLPAAAAVHIEDEVDCTVCSLRRAGLPDPARPRQPYKARPAAQPRVQTIEDHEMRWTLTGEPHWRRR